MPIEKMNYPVRGTAGPLDADRPNYEIPLTPAYDPEIAQLLNTDRVNATLTVNPLLQRIVTNTHSVMLYTQGLVAQLAALTGYHITGEAANVASLPPAVDLPPGTQFVVRNDEQHEGKTTVWEIDENGEWAFVGGLDAVTGNNIELSDTPTPATGTRAHLRVITDVPGYQPLK